MTRNFVMYRFYLQLLLTTNHRAVCFYYGAQSWDQNCGLVIWPIQFDYLTYK